MVFSIPWFGHKRGRAPAVATELDPTRPRWWRRIWRRPRAQGVGRWRWRNRRREYRVARRNGISAAVTATVNYIKLKLLILVGTIASFVAKGFDATIAFFQSIPRTRRALMWALRAGYAYKQAALYGPSESEEHAVYVSELHGFWATRLLETCRQNGGVYVKAGQFAAAFGAVPMEYRRQLQLLQDKASPRPFKKIDRVIKQEFGYGADIVFAEFARDATAAASLAQVHRAKLYNGKEVAVKIQYPGLSSAVHADLATLSLLSRVAALAFPRFNLGWLLTELKVKLREELDFTVEVHNSGKLRQFLAKGSCLTVPKIFVEFTSSKIITMEWVEGYKVSDVDTLRRHHISPRAVGLQLERAFADMMLVHGWVHADPHPGNIMVRPKGRKGLLSWLFNGSYQPFEIVLLDHGTYAAIPTALRRQYCQLWCAMFIQDAEKSGTAAMAMGGQRAAQVLPVILQSKASNRQESERVKKKIGMQSFGDLTELLAYAPRDLVELLRITAVLRSVTAQLGTSLADRLRVSVAFARKSFSAGNDDNAGLASDDVFDNLQIWLKFWCRFGLLSATIVTGSVLHRVFLASLYAFGQPVTLI